MYMSVYSHIINWILRTAQPQESRVPTKISYISYKCTSPWQAQRVSQTAGRGLSLQMRSRAERMPFLELVRHVLEAKFPAQIVNFDALKIDYPLY